MADDPNWWSAAPLVNTPAPAQASGDANWWAAAPLAPSGRPSRAALPMAQAETLPPEQPEPSLSDIPRAAVAGVAGAARELGQAPAAVMGHAPAQLGRPEPYYTEPLTFGDLLHPSRAAPKIAFSLSKSIPSLAGAVAGGVAGAVLAPESGPVGPLVGTAIGAGGVSAVQSLAPLMADEMAKPGADPNTAYEHALARAGQEGVFSGAAMALFGWAPFKQAAKDILFQAFAVQSGAAVAQRGVENVEQGRPVTEGMAEAVPGAVAGTLVPMAAHAAVTRFAGRTPTPGEPGGGPTTAETIAPRVRTPEEIENEDGVGPEAAQRVAQAEATAAAPAAQARAAATEAAQPPVEVPAPSPQPPAATPTEAPNAPPPAPEAAPAGPAAAAEAPAILPAQAPSEGAAPVEAAPPPREPVGRPDPGTSLLPFLIDRGGLQPHGDLRAMDAHIARPGLVRKTGMQLDYAREAAAEAGFLPMDSTISDFLDLVGRELKGQKQYGNHLPEQITPGTDVTGREEARREALTEDVRMAAEDAGVHLGGATLDHAVHLAQYGMPVPQAVREAMQFGGQGPPIEDIPFGRRPPMPPQSGAPLLGEAPREPQPRPEAEPTIRNDPRQEGLFPPGGEAVRAQAARDQAGPRGGQKPADEGLFAPKEPEQGPLFGRGVTPITAYHGSPHDFDRFDISKIGTGEGAQAYGHGLYFAEREGVARSYKQAGQPGPFGAIAGNIARGALADAQAAGAADAAATARASLHDRYKSEGDPALKRHYQDALNNFEEFTKPGSDGRMYQAALHLDQDKTLDWDRPLSEQAPGVRAALERMSEAFKDSLGEHAENHNRNSPYDAPEDYTGGEFIRAASHYNVTDGIDHLAEQLHAAGIEGIRYLDQGSRARVADVALHEKNVAHFQNLLAEAEAKWRGEPIGKPVVDYWRQAVETEKAALEAARQNISRNYVVFDDKLIDIERKYGRAAQARAAGEAPHPEAVRTAIDAARKITGNRVRIETYDADHDVFRVRFPDGKTEQVFGYTLGRLIRAAIEPNRTGWNLNHEAVHALKALGVFTPGEWRTLEAAARRGGWVEAENVPGRYPGLTDAQHIEEAIAERFARWTTEPRAAAPLISRLGGKIAAFFDRLRNALAGRGFRTADDVFGAMQRGDVGAREPAAHAPSMAESVGAARRFEAAQGITGMLQPQFSMRDRRESVPDFNALTDAGIARVAKAYDIAPGIGRDAVIARLKSIYLGEAAASARRQAPDTNRAETNSPIPELSARVAAAYRQENALREQVQGYSDVTTAQFWKSVIPGTRAHAEMLAKNARYDAAVKASAEARVDLRLAELREQRRSTATPSFGRREPAMGRDQKRKGTEIAPGAPSRRTAQEPHLRFNPRQPEGGEGRIIPTETPEFKRWFGNSRITTADGAPLVVYHATDADIAKFSDRFAGTNTDRNASSPELAQTARLGHWFSDQTTIAERMSAHATYPVYLKIERPFDTSLDDLVERIREVGSGRNLRQELEASGYDGLRVADEEFGGTSFVAFDPRQIKSAIGNRGTFDPNDPRITFGRRDKEREFPAIARTRETAGIARRAADEVKQLFAPTSRGPEAKRAEYLIRASAAAKAQAAARSTDALERFGHMVARLPEEEQLAITDRREAGQAQPTTPLNEVINTLRQQQDQWMRKVRSLGPEYLKTLRENYMGHIWANYPEWKAGIEAEEAAARERGEGLAQAQMRGKSPLKGSGAFLKQRTFDTQREGMAAGLIPVTTNPIEMQLLKLYEMQRFYHGVKLADDIKNSGLAHWVPYNDEAGARASGYVKLDDTAFQPRVTEPGEYGRKEYGNWWAPEPVARVFNNYVSRGLAGHSAIYDAVRGAGNALNSAQLSMSGFHATFIAFDTMMSKLALGIQQLSRGEPIRALGSMAQGLSPTAIFSTVRQGAMLRDAYLHPEQASPQMRKLVQALIAGGGRIAMDPFYRSTAAGSFVKRLGDLKQPGSILHDAWQMAKDTPIAAPMRIVGRLMDTLNEPLMGNLVPRAKLGVFADLASDFLRRNPEATEEQTAAAMTKAWDSVDNRMGQLVYDNLFWNKTAKDLAFITTRSVGWNLGSVREIGGAAVDLAAQGARTAKGLANVARGKPFGLPPEVTNRMAYVVGMTVISGLYGAILNYAMTGQGPQSLLDYFYPRMGTETEPGVPDRTTMPGYIKDVMAFKNDPLGTVGNKTQPLIETGIELAKNRDYYGGIIHMPNADNPAVSYPEYLLNQAIPFSWRGWLKTREQGASSLTQALNFFGIQPAPKSIVSPERGEAYQQRQDIRALKARMRENAKGRITMGAPP